jgi:hypothetical protein
MDSTTAISTPTKSAYVCVVRPVLMALSTLHTSHAFLIRLGHVTPTGCQNTLARDAWSRPHDTVQSSDNRGSWGTLFAARSEPPLSPGPHHDPGALLMIPAMLTLIIRAVMRCQLDSPATNTGNFSRSALARSPFMARYPA